MITIPIKKNKTFDISFKCSTKSDFLWKVKEVSEGVSFVRSEFETLPENASVSEHTFTFSAEKVGQNSIVFALTKDNEVLEEKSYVINIKE